MSDLREKIKNAKDINSEIVHVWNCDIEVKTIMAKDRARILNEVMSDDGKINNANFHILMIIDSCYDPETNEKIFSHKDAEWLSEKSAGSIEKLSAVVMKLSGLTKDSMEETEKN